MRGAQEIARKGADMPRTVSIGCQDFETIKREGYFYIDKSCFIKEWWEEGFGRYDVMLEPRDKADDAFVNNRNRDAIIMEFKVHDPEEEHSLEDTVAAALKQIEEKHYAYAWYQSCQGHPPGVDQKGLCTLKPLIKDNLVVHLSIAPGFFHSALVKICPGYMLHHHLF